MWTRLEGKSEGILNPKTLPNVHSKATVQTGLLEEEEFHGMCHYQDLRC